ncbi:MAG: response regulator [Elusimicrobiaceae bacterium]|nr:response regulator [Elusimicrobiaceae bacterium]
MNKTILIVDDDEIIRTLVSEILKAAGYRTDTAINGRDAVDKTLVSSPDLILLDIVMPEMNGIDACRALKANPATKNIPIIMLSSAGQITEIEEALSAGAITYVAKPCERDRIIHIIEDTLNPPKEAEWLKVQRPKKS